MNDSAPQKAPPTRRGLLKTLAALGALSMTGTEGALAARASAARPLRVAVIVPSASQYPQLAQQFQRGLEAALGGQAVKLTTYPTGPLPKAAQATTRSALEAGTDLLILLGDGLSGSVREVLYAQPVPVLAAELGAYLPDAQPQTAPLTATISLQAWEAEWAHGAHLARSGTPKLHLLISQLDSGYDLPYAFSSGFTGAGGTLTGTTIFNEMRPDLEALSAEVRRSGAGAVHVLASGKGDGVVAALLRAGFRVTTGGLTAPTRQKNVDSALAAAPSRLSADAKALLGGATDPILLLGYDTGRWLSTALTQLPAGTPASGLTLYAALAHTPVQGARGLLQADQRGLLRAPLLLSRSNGTQLALTAPNPNRPEFHREGGLRSGWLYTYLYS